MIGFVMFCRLAMNEVKCPELTEERLALLLGKSSISDHENVWTASCKCMRSVSAPFYALLQLLQQRVVHVLQRTYVVAADKMGMKGAPLELGLAASEYGCIVLITCSSA